MPVVAIAGCVPWSSPCPRARSLPRPLDAASCSINRCAALAVLLAEDDALARWAPIGSPPAPRAPAPAMLCRPVASSRSRLRASRLIAWPRCYRSCIARYRLHSAVAAPAEPLLSTAGPLRPLFPETAGGATTGPLPPAGASPRQPYGTGSALPPPPPSAASSSSSSSSSCGMATERERGDEALFPGDLPPSAGPGVGVAPVILFPRCTA